MLMMLVLGSFLANILANDAHDARLATAPEESRKHSPSKVITHDNGLPTRDPLQREWRLDEPLF